MTVMRPAALSDLDALVDLAHQTGFGLTTLPRDPQLLEKRIAKSLRSFAEMSDQPAGECYLFVMEDLDAHKVIGTSGVVSKVGGFEPFYAYRIETTVHQSELLGVRKEIRLLHLVTEHNGPAEIGSLFLSPAHRHGGNGRLLSLSRFLFMAEHSRCFDPMVIAEMRGVIDEQGRSPFWNAIGHHFFDIDFPKADFLSLVDKRFIADLMPKHPIYIVLLPEEAQQVIGQVHEQTRPARHLLESEGFRFRDMVDIFEAGPVVTCPLGQIRSVRCSRRAAVTAISDESVAGEVHLVGRVQGEFRACAAPLRTTDAGVELDRQCAEALQIARGAPVRVVPLFPSHPQEPVHESDTSFHPQPVDQLNRAATTLD